MWEDFEEEKKDKFKEVRVEGFVVDFYIKSIKIVLFKIIKIWYNKSYIILN